MPSRLAGLTALNFCPCHDLMGGASHPALYKKYMSSFYNDHWCEMYCPKSIIFAICLSSVGLPYVLYEIRITYSSKIYFFLEVAKLQTHLNLLREEYVKLQARLAEYEKKYQAVAAASGKLTEDNFVSRLLSTVAGLLDKELYRYKYPLSYACWFQSLCWCCLNKLVP